MRATLSGEQVVRPAGGEVDFCSKAVENAVRRFALYP